MAGKEKGKLMSRAILRQSELKDLSVGNGLHKGADMYMYVACKFLGKREIKLCICMLPVMF